MFGRKKNTDFSIPPIPDLHQHGEKFRVYDVRYGPEQTRLWEIRLGNVIRYEFECRHCHGLLAGYNDAKKYSKEGKENKKEDIFQKSTTREYMLIVGLCPLCLDREVGRIEQERRHNDPEYQDIVRQERKELARWERKERKKELQKEDKKRQKEEKRKKNEQKKEASKSIQQKELEKYERDYLNRLEKEKMGEDRERREDAQIIINKMIDDGVLPEELEREGAYRRLAGYASSKMPDQQGFKCANCNFKNNLDETFCAWCNRYLSKPY